MNAQTGAPVPLERGDAAPVFAAAGPGTPHYFIRQASGAPAVLCFFGSAGNSRVRGMLEAARQEPLFDGKSAAFIGIGADRGDVGRLTNSPPGFRVLWDFDRRIAGLCGFAQAADALMPRASIVFDRRLRVLETVPIENPENHLGAVLDVLARAGDRAGDDAAGGSAPVLMVPRVFEPEFCRKLIADCAGRSGDDSGFMATDPATGNTVLQRDHEFKRRRDFTISDAGVRMALHQRLLRRLLPEIDKAFEFRATRIERYLVACYDSAVGGYFGPHRDNGTRATAHRRFAVTINLNAEAYEGGDLRFPEFDGTTFRAPTGGAAVFACSLTHEVVPMIAGTRYCFLPFLYDERSAQFREENLKYLAQENSGPRGLTDGLDHGPLNVKGRLLRTAPSGVVPHAKREQPAVKPISRSRRCRDRPAPARRQEAGVLADMASTFAAMSLFWSRKACARFPRPGRYAYRRRSTRSRIFPPRWP